ncbi:hypothetical protein TGRUB_202040 [Toxoplasma gondii RUB]|uniref:Uncharacterized protein n=6 Tax=Toxoplasma gondii TaxID=5811 RepID=A0A086LZH7_TOXGO|nr:hypothetical protein TGDOM2_202040 [Toxoplasma gondii GAB2-2007-GAL-DOM2]KFG45450.1 hypothetical protein TGP89_202040 [Toxoplasma gondii p89]KFG53580.1 hypothetical protein TGFOU_202040 [Toxoplasma gondii FOU]KFG62045.1 hypothetical protein TGRUB_202040 [Toxoplasma gondii RUB]PUA89547.1 hypothetical protein TGBR9_202040 [Toxoplasma gondii TgCATBr9]RQX73365.1 hypothetical protein TGCAST_202040 [Toxoplasma gondii CAST]
MAAAPPKMVIPPTPLKKPNIVVKKPLIPVSPAGGLKKPGPGGPVKAPPPKPVPVAKKLPGHDAAAPEKKPFVKPAPKPTGTKAALTKPALDKSGKAAKEAKAAKPAETKPASKKEIATKQVAKGKGKAAKAAAAPAKKAASSGGFFSRLFRRKKIESDNEKPKPVVTKPIPKFDKVEPRKVLAKKFVKGTSPANSFRPRFGKAAEAPVASPKVGQDGTAPLTKGLEPEEQSKAPGSAAAAVPKTAISPKTPVISPKSAISPKPSAACPKPPATSPKTPETPLQSVPGPPPLKGPPAVGAKTEATEGKEPGPTPDGSKPALPKILPKKPPGLDTIIAPKKVEIAPKKLPTATEKAKDSAKEPSPSSKADTKAGAAEHDAKKPSPPERGKQQEAPKGGPAPRRTLADLLAKGSASAPERADKDDSLTEKVKAFFRDNPQHIPEAEADLKSPDLSDSVVTIVLEGIETSPEQKNAVKAAIKTVYNTEIATRCVRDYLAAEWSTRRAELIDGKLGPEPVAKEVQKDNPKIVEARDWIAVAQDTKAAAVAVRNALEDLKKKGSAYDDLLKAPFRDSAKFKSVADPIISSIQAKPEMACLSSRALQAQLEDFVAHEQALPDVKAFLEKEPNVARSIVDAYKFRETPAAGTKAATTTGATKDQTGTAAGAKKPGSAGGAKGPGTAGGAKATSTVGGTKLRPIGVGRPATNNLGARALGGGATKRLGGMGRVAQQPKESVKSLAEKFFNEAMEAINAAFVEKYRTAILVGVIHELEAGLTIPKGTCWLADMLLTVDKTTGVFDHHSVISYMFGFFDSISYLRFRECSKLTHRAVEMDLDKRLFHFPLQTRRERTDIGYFYQVVSFFCGAAARLAPLDRKKYLPPSVLKAAEWMVPMSPDAMQSHVFVSLDRLPHDMISLVESEKPLPHLWRRSHSKPDSLGKAISTEIDLHDFVWEYRQRVSVVRDEIVWQHPVDGLDEDSVCALFQNMLRILKQIAERHNGICLFRRSEYLLNTDIHITHRIWLQCSVSWGGVLEAPESMIRLYFTIADNFSWNG